MLFADRPLTLLDQRVNRRKVSRPFDQKPAESLPRRVKSWRVIEVTHQWQQLGKREAHWARNSTVCSDGVSRRGAGSRVTRTPTIGRGTSGRRSVAREARPESSGVIVPALTGSVVVSSQI